MVLFETKAGAVVFHKRQNGTFCIIMWIHTRGEEMEIKTFYCTTDNIVRNLNFDSSGNKEL